MTDKQYSDAQRYIGIVQGFAESLGENGILLRNTAIKLSSLVDELYHPREELRQRIEELKLKAGGNYDVKVDDDRPHSYL